MEKPNITILIVDDTATNLQILTTIVTTEGYNILLAQSGEEALRVANEYHPDIILLDIMMSKMDGFDVCRQLKANPSTQPIPVIFVTARTDVEAVEKGFDVGGDDYVSKPFNDRVLLARLKNHVERYQRQRELTINRERLNTALDAAQIGSFTIRLPEKKWIPDEQLLRLFGIESTEDTFEMNTWYEHVIPQDIENTITSIEECIVKNSSCKFEFRIFDPHGEIKWFRCSMQVTERNEKDEPLLIVGVNVDITKEHSMLDTIRIQEETLAQSRKLKAMGQLTGGIAHDFNNMLATILGFAELLGEDLKDNEEYSYYCKNITDTCERAATLTDQLLTFSRKQSKQTTVIDLHGLILGSMDLLRHSLGKNISIKQKLGAKEHFIMGEFAQLQNILLNMGFNARDAMPKGGILELTTENVSIYEKDILRFPVDIEIGNYIVLHVRDTGTGMEKEVLDKIFEPFFTTKQAGKGTGLGLSTTYGTINAHNGNIFADSTPGEGTTFHIYFPVSDLKPKETVAKKANAARNSVEGGTILVIDDEEAIRRMLMKTLNYVGYEVLEADSGKIGIDLYKQEKDRISAVILDVIMPEMDGVQIFKALKKINPDVAVLVSTGYASNKQTVELRNLGVEGFLKKPYRQSELVDAVNKVIHHS
ncbi:MAG: response regulator [Candidatus Marinimicrobia bacterium]|nr:response regulator [Candidatus Neomarinimicrobiota bacterium]